MNSIICFRNYKTDEQTLSNYDHLSSVCSDVVHIYDYTNKSKLAGAYNICYDDYVNNQYPLAPLDDILKVRGNKGKPVNEKLFDGWIKQQQMWFNTTHAIMLYWQDYPDYDYYWSLDCDLWFNGNWQDFFKLYENDSADFLGTALRELKSDSKKPYLNNFNFDVPYKRRMASYGCCQRFSNSLLQWVDREYKQGNFTFFEQMFPSVCIEFGGTAKDLNSQGRFTYATNTVYNSKVSQYYMKNTANSKNKLFHRMI